MIDQSHRMSPLSRVNAINATSTSDATKEAVVAAVLEEVCLERGRKGFRWSDVCYEGGVVEFRWKRGLVLILDDFRNTCCKSSCG